MPARKLPPNDELIALYRSGLSTGEIGERFGCAACSVAQALKRVGEPRRSAAEAAELLWKSGRGKPGRYWLGKKQPPELVERRVSPIRGERHYLWKGGDSRRPYRFVIEKQECANCGSRENLGIHHIDLDHFNNDPANLQVLCSSCHMSLHKQAYWDAIHAGQEPPKSNGPVGWRREGGDDDGKPVRAGRGRTRGSQDASE